jgi:uncharacterized protein with FMN-binding domain
MSTALIIVIVAVSVTIGSSIGLYKASEKNMKEVHGMVVPSVDITNLKDSVYNGTFSYIGMPHRVAVTVKNHTIQEIEITKKYKRQWFKMAEGVIPRVIESQNTTVDAVCGATTSSKALLMAIHNALAPEEKRMLK